MLGRYYPITSLIHKMNPVAKILCTILFIIMVLLANNLFTHTLIFILLILILLSSKVPMKEYFFTIFKMKWLLLFILILNIIFMNNLENTAIMLLMVIDMVLYSCVLTLTTPPSELTYGLEKVLSPLKLFKVPVNKMALTLTLALRFIPSIMDTGNKILKSQASRGIDYYNSNIKGKVLALRSLIIPMFALTMKKADDLADIMAIRLYDVNQKRTNFRQNHWGFYDTFILLVHISLLILIVVRR